MNKILHIIIKLFTVILGVAGLVHGATFNVNSHVNDNSIGEGNGGIVLGWTGEVNLVAGDDNLANNKANMAGIMVFELPDLGAGTISTANLAGYAEQDWHSGTASLYGIRYDSTSNVVLGDYGYIATVNPTDVLIQTDFYTYPGTNNPAVLTETDATGDANLASWLSDQYTAGAVAGDYVFIRFHANQASANQAFFQSGNSSNPPVLTITTAIPEPGTMALVLLSLGGLLLFRRRS